MICNNCRSQIEGNPKFCPMCGTPVEYKQQWQPQTNVPEAGNPREVVQGFRPLGSPAPSQPPIPLPPLPTPPVPAPSYQGFPPSYDPQQFQQTTQEQSAPPPPNSSSSLPDQRNYNWQNNTQYQQQSYRQDYYSTRPTDTNRRHQQFNQTSGKRGVNIALTTIAIIALIVGLFLPVLKLTPNVSAILGDYSGMDFDSMLGDLGIQKPVFKVYPLDLMLEKPPRLDIGVDIDLIQNALGFDFEESWREIIEFSKISDEPDAKEARTFFTILKMIGIGLLAFVIVISIFGTVRLINPKLGFAKFALSMFSSILLLALIGGLIYLYTLKAPSDLSSYLGGSSSTKFSDFITITPGIGFILMAIGSIGTITTTFIKE